MDGMMLCQRLLRKGHGFLKGSSGKFSDWRLK